MKTLFVIFIFTLFLNSIFAQDQIFLKSKNIISGNVQMLTKTDLYYKPLSDNSIITSIPLIKVDYIIYQDKHIEYIQSPEITLKIDEAGLSSGDHIIIAAKQKQYATAFLFAGLSGMFIIPILAVNDVISFKSNNQLYYTAGISGGLFIISCSINISANKHLSKSGKLLN